MDAQENDAYLSTLNELKPTRQFDFADAKLIKVGKEGGVMGVFFCALL